MSGGSIHYTRAKPLTQIISRAGDRVRGTSIAANGSHVSDAAQPHCRWVARCHGGNGVYDAARGPVRGQRRPGNPPNSGTGTRAGALVFHTPARGATVR